MTAVDLSRTSPSEAIVRSFVSRSSGRWFAFCSVLFLVFCVDLLLWTQLNNFGGNVVGRIHDNKSIHIRDPSSTRWLRFLIASLASAFSFVSYVIYKRLRKTPTQKLVAYFTTAILFSVLCVAVLSQFFLVDYVLSRGGSPLTSHIRFLEIKGGRLKYPFPLEGRRSELGKWWLRALIGLLHSWLTLLLGMVLSPLLDVVFYARKCVLRERWLLSLTSEVRQRLTRRRCAADLVVLVRDEAEPYARELRLHVPCSFVEFKTLLARKFDRRAEHVEFILKEAAQTLKSQTCSEEGTEPPPGSRLKNRRLTKGASAVTKHVHGACKVLLSDKDDLLLLEHGQMLWVVWKESASASDVCTATAAAPKAVPAHEEDCSLQHHQQPSKDEMKERSTDHVD